MSHSSRSHYRELCKARKLGAPWLIIKACQIKIVLARKGLKWSYTKPSEVQRELETRYDLY